MAAPSTGSGHASSVAARPLRADAQRNRDRLIEAAVAAFGEHGLDVGVAEIARRAGVGTATLFRNFATKDDLVYAVIEARVTELVAIAGRALEVEDPGAAFEQLLFDIADFQLRDRGFFDAVHMRIIDEPELLDCKRGLSTIADQILVRAQAAGAVRDDIVEDDLRFIVMAAVRDVDPDSEPGVHRRYLRILLDGLRPASASPLPARRDAAA